MNDAVTCGLACLQGTLALLVVVGAVVLLIAGTDECTGWKTRWALIGLALWGMWLLWSASKGQPDSLPSQAMTALVLWGIVRCGRPLLEGDHHVHLPR